MATAPLAIRAGRAAFAGNLPLKTPFGTIYTSNITPDTETGIGTWSKEAFRRAMKDGVDRKGHHLYPAFPYDHFTKVKDADIDAIYAYLMAAVEPVRETTRDNELGFPVQHARHARGVEGAVPRQDAVEAGSVKGCRSGTRAPIWSKVSAIAAPAIARATSWVRGRAPAYGGGSAEGWYAPPLNKDNLSQQPWTKIEFVVYLMDGWHAKHGMAAGPMTPVVDALHKQNEIDVFAIAAYVGTLRAGEKPIDASRRADAALRLEWGHPDAPPVPRGIQRGRQGVRSALRAVPSQRWRHRAAGAANLDSRAGARQRRAGDPGRHQAADRCARPVHAGLRPADVGRGDQRAGEIPARALQHAAAVENVGARVLHPGADVALTELR